MILADPGFGNVFTDHMVRLRWLADRGWHDGAGGTVQGRFATGSGDQFAALRAECLRGLRRPTGMPTVASTRSGRWPTPNGSAARPGGWPWPNCPTTLFLGSIEALLAQDGAWVPDDADKSLYLRPFMFSTEVGLGVRPADEYLYLLIASPAGAYFKAASSRSPCG